MLANGVDLIEPRPARVIRAPARNLLPVLEQCLRRVVVQYRLGFPCALAIVPLDADLHGVVLVPAVFDELFECEFALVACMLCRATAARAVVLVGNWSLALGAGLVSRVDRRLRFFNYVFALLEIIYRRRLAFPRIDMGCPFERERCLTAGPRRCVLNMRLGLQLRVSNAVFFTDGSAYIISSPSCQTQQTCDSMRAGAARAS